MSTLSTTDSSPNFRNLPFSFAQIDSFKQIINLLTAQPVLFAEILAEFSGSEAFEDPNRQALMSLEKLEDLIKFVVFDVHRFTDSGQSLVELGYALENLICQSYGKAAEFSFP